MAKLTDMKIRNAKPAPGKKILKLADGDGLYLWCFDDGRRYWRLRYYTDGKERLAGLGVYPDTGLKEARQKAAVLREQLAGGVDPVAVKKAASKAEKAAQADTFRSFAEAWHATKSPDWVSQYVGDSWKRLERHAFPTLGAMPVSSIAAPDVLAVVKKIQTDGADALAFRVLGDIRRILDYAINCGRLTHNVAVGREGALRSPKPENRAHVSQKEFPALIQAINQYEEKGGTRLVMRALQLIALTFVRANELLQAQWTEFDLDKAEWEIPASRMKMKKALIVPLAPAVVEILHELKTLNPNSKFILPGRGRNKGISDNTLRYALSYMGYGGRQTVHGFRHVASTALHEARDGDHKLFHSDAIERQLAHVSGGVRGIYDKSEHLPERRRIMNWWADYIASCLLSPDKPTDERAVDRG